MQDRKRLVRDLLRSDRQRMLFDTAVQQHFLAIARSDPTLENAYWKWCTEHPWHPYIRVWLGARYANVELNVDAACDEHRFPVVHLTDAAREQVWQVFQTLFHETTDRWRRDGLVMSSGYARGIPVELVDRLVEAVWPLVSTRDAYVTSGPPWD